VTPPEQVVAGIPIPAINRIKLFSPTEWEEFILEWVDSLRETYDDVRRCGGAGDLGRDVVAFAAGSSEWDNYQCKHYDHPLYPSDIWCELGKVLYYSHRGDFTFPRRYLFVAPQGAGTTLLKLMRSAEQLRSGLVENWDRYCLTGITSTGDVPLSGDLREYVDSSDFGIFDAIPPLRIIEAHRRTRWHVARFGGGLPARPPAINPPDQVDPSEIRYVGQLLEAYGDHLGAAVTEPPAPADHPNLARHFRRCREDFYSAESLRNFSRDTLPPGEFEKLQGEVFDGVVEVATGLGHADGYARVCATTQAARMLPITAHALVSRLYVRDKSGICHQFANDDRLRWVP